MDRQETALQTELQLRPLLTVTYLKENVQVVVENIGKGMARDLRLSDTELPASVPDTRVFIRWRPKDFVLVGRERGLIGSIILRDADGVETVIEENQTNIASRFSEHVAEPAKQVILEYGNLVNVRYRTTVVIDQGFSTITEDVKLGA